MEFMPKNEIKKIALLKTSTNERLYSKHLKALKISKYEFINIRMLITSKKYFGAS